MHSECVIHWLINIAIINFGDILILYHSVGPIVIKACSSKALMTATLQKLMNQNRGCMHNNIIIIMS